MSIIVTGNATHDANLLSYEQTRQAAVEVAGVTPAAVKSAHVSYYRSCIASAKTNGLHFTQFSTVLRELIGQDANRHGQARHQFICRHFAWKPD